MPEATITLVPAAAPDVGPGSVATQTPVPAMPTIPHDDIPASWVQGLDTENEGLMVERITIDVGAAPAIAIRCGVHPLNRNGKPIANRRISEHRITGDLVQDGMDLMVQVGGEALRLKRLIGQAARDSNAAKLAAEAEARAARIAENAEREAKATAENALAEAQNQISVLTEQVSALQAQIEALTAAQAAQAAPAQAPDAAV